MRLASSFDTVQSQEQAPDRVGDALASACLFGIVGGLVFAFAIVPAVSAILVGATIGALAGIVIAYH